MNQATISVGALLLAIAGITQALNLPLETQQNSFDLVEQAFSPPESSFNQVLNANDFATNHFENDITINHSPAEFDQNEPLAAFVDTTAEVVNPQETKNVATADVLSQVNIAAVLNSLKTPMSAVAQANFPQLSDEQDFSNSVETLNEVDSSSEVNEEPFAINKTPLSIAALMPSNVAVVPDSAVVGTNIELNKPQMTAMNPQITQGQINTGERVLARDGVLSTVTENEKNKQSLAEIIANNIISGAVSHEIQNENVGPVSHNIKAGLPNAENPAQAPQAEIIANNIVSGAVSHEIQNENVGPISHNIHAGLPNAVNIAQVPQAAQSALPAQSVLPAQSALPAQAVFETTNTHKVPVEVQAVESHIQHGATPFEMKPVQETSSEHVQEAIIQAEKAILSSVLSNSTPTKSDTTSKVTTNAHIDKIVCPSEQNEGDIVVQFASPSDCNIFYKCNRGVAHLVKCPDGLHYNERIEACDFAYRANCKLVSKMEIV